MSGKQASLSEYWYQIIGLRHASNILKRIFLCLLVLTTACKEQHTNSLDGAPVKDTTIQAYIEIPVGIEVHSVDAMVVIGDWELRDHWLHYVEVGSLEH